MLSNFESLSGYLNIIEAAARSVRPSHLVTTEDLISAGKVALVACLRQHGGIGNEQEVRALCYVRVRGAMLDELRNADPLNRRSRAMVRTVRAQLKSLSKELGRDPTLDELAGATSLSTAAVKQALALSARDSAPEVADFEKENLVDERASSPAVFFEASDLRAALMDALSELPGKQSAVLQAYYLDELTLAEIGAQIGASKERVRQIRESGIQNLRRRVAALGVWQVLIANRA